MRKFSNFTKEKRLSNLEGRAPLKSDCKIGEWFGTEQSKKNTHLVLRNVGVSLFSPLMIDIESDNVLSGPLPSEISSLTALNLLALVTYI